ncbi:MAG: hypothetical protein J6N18_03795 [Kiritimatiellae bacterium]|nr:hypothetical protein [Kiritimatiellia bacterium]
MKTKTRHGQHHEDLVGFCGYITPELKALAQVTANELDTTMMDLVRNGIQAEAIRAGIVVDGKIAQKYRPIIAAYADAYRTKKKLNKTRKEKGNA